MTIRPSWLTRVYHPDVKARDVPKLNRDVSKRIQRAVENRLAVEPQRYGEPLRRTLKGYWKLRVGDYRVVFKIVRNEVWIFAIMQSKAVQVSRVRGSSGLPQLGS